MPIEYLDAKELSITVNEDTAKAIELQFPRAFKSIINKQQTGGGGGSIAQVSRRRCAMWRF